MAESGLLKPARGIGQFFATLLDTVVLTFKPPFAWQEFILQFWFIARVTLLPAIMLAVPGSVLVSFIFNVLLIDLGAVDYAGAATGILLAQLGPLIAVTVISGAASTAICADLGARTIREELDAMRVLGINPIQRLVVPRVLACSVVAALLAAIVCITDIVGSYFFAVYAQGVTPGSFAGLIATQTKTVDIVFIFVKSVLFGYVAAVIGCFKGMTVGGGPAGVGTAVNETVVYAFMALFGLNIIVTAVQFGGARGI